MHQNLFHLPSRLDEISLPVLEKAGVRLFLKRDDLIHPEISGNKWRKLKFNVAEAKNQNKNNILTYGGAFSNHIYATAAACKLLGMQSVGVIRGNNFKTLSHTLQFAESCGMKLKFTSREEFETRRNVEFKEALHLEFGDFFDVPEGGANALGVKGCEEVVAEIDIPYDMVAVACGTATTFRGIVNQLPETKTALGFPALRHNGSLNDAMAGVGKANWQFVDDYHFGGYAKVTDELRTFWKEFRQETGIELDLVYTAKMMFGLLDLVGKGYFKPGTTVVAIHTGGLQGNKLLG